MLDADEQRAPVRRRVDTGDLALLRAGQEALERCRARPGPDMRGLLRSTARALVGDRHIPAIADEARQRGQHHAIGTIGHRAVVRLDPQQRVDLARHVMLAREPQTVRAGEVVVVVQAADVHVRPGIGRVGTEQVDVPDEAGRRVIVSALADTDDVAIGVAVLVRAALGIVIVPRIGRIGAVHRTVRGVVVGQSQVDFAGLRIAGRPFGTIHWRRFLRIGGQPGMGQDVGLISKDIFRIAAGRRPVGNLTENQRHPATGTVLVELRDIERSGIEIFVTEGQTASAIAVARLPRGGRDEFVEIFAARVVAHIDRDLLALRQLAEPCTFVAHPAQSSTLARRAGRVIGVDFQHPAELVGFVAVIVCGSAGIPGARVPATEGRVVRIAWGHGRPGVIAGRAANAITVQPGQLARGAIGIVAAAAEIERPVLFTGQQRTPAGNAVGAIVDRAATGRARGRICGFEQVSARHRPIEHNRRVWRDTTVEGTVLHPLPLARTDIDIFGNADAMRLDFLDRLFFGARAGRAIGGAIRMQILLVQVLVVLGEQAALGIGVVALAIGAEREEIQRVAMVADAVRETGIGSVIGIGRDTRRDRVAQTGHDLDRVTGWYGDDVVEVFVDGRKGQLGRADLDLGHLAGGSRGRSAALLERQFGHFADRGRDELRAVVGRHHFHIRTTGLNPATAASQKHGSTGGGCDLVTFCGDIRVRHVFIEAGGQHRSADKRHCTRL